jgi:hypothetical protein
VSSPLSPSSVVRGVKDGVEHLARGVRERLGSAGPGADPGGWLAVTVLADRDTVVAGGLPAPLAELGDRIAVEVRPAPGDKGTEIAARIAQDETGAATADTDASDLQDRLREALRLSKSLLETGRVMRVDPQPAGKRSSSPAGKGIDTAQEHGREKGVL